MYQVRNYFPLQPLLGIKYFIFSRLQSRRIRTQMFPAFSRRASSRVINSIEVCTISDIILVLLFAAVIHVPESDHSLTLSRIPMLEHSHPPSAATATAAKSQECIDLSLTTKSESSYRQVNTIRVNGASCSICIQAIGCSLISSIDYMLCGQRCSCCCRYRASRSSIC